MDKQIILDDPSQFTDEEIARLIVKGEVTMEELQATGEFPAKRRKNVQKLIDGREEQDWQQATTANTIDGYRSYLDNYPEGKYREEARDRISSLRADASIADEWAQVDKSSVTELRRFVDAHPDSSFASEAQKMLDRLEQSAWKDVDKDNIDSLKRFIEEFPDSSYRSAAEKRISELQKDAILGESLASQIREILSDNTRVRREDDALDFIRRRLQSGKITKGNLLDVIEDDNNILSAYAVNQLIEGREIGCDDLLNIGIDPKFIKMLGKRRPAPPSAPSETLTKVHRQKTTEVYFWGIPASGKSCALGAVMSAAREGRIAKTMIPDPHSQAYGYMQRLSSLFETGKVDYLPAGTAVQSISEMAFDLIDGNGREHSVTFIDLAGELVRIMRKSIANEAQNLTNQEEQVLETLTAILKGNRGINTKIHFFVIEYGGENRKYDGVSQSDYLDSTLSYIEDTGIIAKDTDAIFLIVTKVDKMKFEKDHKNECLERYIKETSKYLGFYEGLKHICKRYEINDGNVEIIPFSLGKVCFQSFCLFDGEQGSNTVLRKVLDYTKKNRVGRLGKLMNIFRS